VYNLQVFSLPKNAYGSGTSCKNGVFRHVHSASHAVRARSTSVRSELFQGDPGYHAGMRDKLIQEYFGVDLEIVWETVRNDLTPLEIAIRKVLEETQ